MPTDSLDSIVHVSLQPQFASSVRESDFRQFCAEFSETTDFSGTMEKLSKDLVQKISSYKTESQNDKDYLVSLISKQIVLDLINQGWQLAFKGSKPGLNYPLFPDNSKELVRKRHSFERDTLLEKESIQQFIKKMEHNGIFSLMRNGQELVDALKKDKTGAIKPYLQFAVENEQCQHTGLRLMDIWRYFRYTWANAYRSTPGRNIRILVRDRAAPNHSIIGIASLGNAVIQQTVRDNWIGWNIEDFLNNFEHPSELVEWCLQMINKSLNDLYLHDLVQQGLYRIDEQNPTNETIAKLQEESRKAMEIYQRSPEETRYLRKTEKPGADWTERTKTHLYKSKRCAKLAVLLSIRKVLQEEVISKFTDILVSKKVQTTLNQLIRVVKGEHVGENMMEITTCGAIAPYNHLLGGKLVSMLVCSFEVIKHYAEKYSQNERIIASSMKGAPVMRKPNLVLLTTTSLYEVGASQYNRIKIPAEEIGRQIEYKKLGLTEGFGTFHLSGTALSLMELLIDSTKSSGRVNSVFGEGPSPLLRKIRDALDIVGLSSGTILNHKSRRIVYGIPLAENFREILTGLASQPKFAQQANVLMSAPSECTRKIADYWKKRWLRARLKNPHILEQVLKHRGPSHGARVRTTSSGAQQGSDNPQLNLLI